MEVKKAPAIYLLVGKPASGKSHCLKGIVQSFQQRKHFKFILAFVRTKFNHDYDYLPSEYVIDEYSDDKVLKHVEKMRTWIKNNPNKQMPPNAVIFDDLMGTIDWTRPEMISWTSTYRHTNTSIFYTSQYLLGSRSTSTALREMVNYAFLYNSKQKNSLKGYYEAFGQLFPNYDSFCEHFQKITKVKYQCMFYDANCEELKENYKGYMAPADIPDFKLTYKI